MGIRRIGLAGLPCILLAGCLAFAPRYSEAIHDKLASTNSALTKIEVAIETRAPGKAPYSLVENLYISALADAKEAQDIADQRPAYFKDRPAARAAELSAANIAACREAIEFSRKTYEASGPAPNQLDNMAIIKNICAIPKTMEGLLK